MVDNGLSKTKQIFLSELIRMVPLEVTKELKNGK